MLVFAREVTVSCKYTDAHDAGRGEYYHRYNILYRDRKRRRDGELSALRMT